MSNTEDAITTALELEQRDDDRLSKIETELEGQPGTLSGLKITVAKLDTHLKSLQARDGERDELMKGMSQKIEGLSTGFVVIQALLKQNRVPSAIWLLLGMGLCAVSLVSLVFLSSRIRIVEPVAAPAAVEAPLAQAPEEP